MKKRTISSVLMISACCLAAQADVYSLNAVGVIRINVEANVPQMAAVQLVPVNASGDRFPISSVLGTNGLPSGTEVKIFIPGNASYERETFNGTAWSPGTNLLQRGQGFWILSPSNCSVKLAGYVPDSASAPTTAVAVVEGLQIMANPYPVAGQFNDPAIAAASEGDVVARLTGTGVQDPQAASVTFLNGEWQPDTGAFDVGDAWWHQGVSNKTWTTVKPYEYP